VYPNPCPRVCNGKITGLKITSSNVVVITSPYLLPLLLLFLLHVFVRSRCTSDHPFCENALWDRIKTGCIKNKRTTSNYADYDRRVARNIRTNEYIYIYIYTHHIYIVEVYTLKIIFFLFPPRICVWGPIDSCQKTYI